MGFKGVIKRLFYIVASVCGIILPAPVFLLIAWLVKRKLGSPVFFGRSDLG